MIGPAGLEERPACRRTLRKVHFSFLIASSKALFQSRASSGETLIKRSAPEAQRPFLQNIAAQILIIFNLF
jgi:hypothetical protein